MAYQNSLDVKPIRALEFSNRLLHKFLVLGILELLIGQKLVGGHIVGFDRQVRSHLGIHGVGVDFDPSSFKLLEKSEFGS